MAEVAERPSLRLSSVELFEVTGYRQAARQLAELHRRGFARAELDRHGQVLLERAHYEAVCRGEQQRVRPRVRPPVVRR